MKQSSQKPKASTLNNTSSTTKQSTKQSTKKPITKKPTNTPASTPDNKEPHSYASVHGKNYDVKDVRYSSLKIKANNQLKEKQQQLKALKKELNRLKYQEAELQEEVADAAAIRVRARTLNSQILEKDKEIASLKQANIIKSNECDARVRGQIRLRGLNEGLVQSMNTHLSAQNNKPYTGYIILPFGKTLCGKFIDSFSKNFGGSCDYDKDDNNDNIPPPIL